MMRSTVAGLLILSATAALGQELALSRFGFQEVLLNMPLSDVPAAYRGDCGSGSDKRFVFCTHSAKVGAVSMTVEITFAKERVVEIQAFFPASEFDTVWSALRQKYGQEDKRDANAVEWYTNPIHPDKPIPDELVLHRRPKDPPKPDGTYYLSNVEYSVIHYESLASARDAMRKRGEERDHKVKGVAEKL
jgi:hypothetical protein